MKIIIHQSLCGEKGGAWDLLKTTIKDQKVAQAIAFKNDLHDTASGKSWGPTIRGFCYDDYFLVIKSFVDPSPAVRPGRAFSHVLILEKKYLPHIENLRVLFDLLPEIVDKDATINEINLDINKLNKIQRVPDINQPFLGRFKKVISGYVNYSQWSNTIVWVGEEDYNEAVAELWERLTVGEKELFNFDIYFNASAVPKTTFNLITISEKHLSKFQNSGYLIIGLNDTAELSTLSEQILVGHKESHERVHSFAEAIGADPFPRAEWDTVGIVLNTFENYELEKDVKRMVTLSHIIAAYSPSPKKGAIFKQKFVKVLADIILSTEYEHFAVLKNFKTESFSKSTDILGNQVSTWLKRRLFTKPAENHQSLKILELLKQPIAKDWLSQWVFKSFKDFFTSGDVESVKIIFYWLDINPNYLTSIESFLLNIGEQNLISALPEKLSVQLVEMLACYARENKLLLFHAHLLLRNLQIEEALMEQLKIDKDPSWTKGIDVILANDAGEKTIQSAVALRDRRLILKAGLVCRSTPSYLNKIDVKNPAWQEIWVEAIRLGNRVDKGFKKFNLILDQVLTLVIQGSGVNSELLSVIANSSFANILTYSKRIEVWSKLNASHKTLFLKATSAFMLSELSNGKNTSVPNDPILSKYVYDHAINDFLYFNKDKARPVIPIFKKFSHIPNSYLEDYIRQFRGILDGGDAKQLGKLVNQRNSGPAAHVIYQRSSKNNSWSIALKECYELLPLVDKAKIFLSGLVPKVKVSKEQWWYNIEELLCNYYPNPVSLTRVWERAGGHEGDLLLGVTARETWAKAIKKLKNKDFKKISMNSLLKEVNDEFGHVEDFKFLYKIRKSYI